MYPVPELDQTSIDRTSRYWPAFPSWPCSQREGRTGLLAQAPSNSFSTFGWPPKVFTGRVNLRAILHPKCHRQQAFFAKARGVGTLYSRRVAAAHQ